MKRALLVPILVVALGVVSRAQTQTAPPTFSTGTQVVLLDLVAKDGKGRSLSDLRQDEVQVFEDGRPCPIESFRLVRSASRPARAGALPVPATVAAAAPAAAAAATPSQANLVVLFFDHLPITLAPYARQGALALLKQSFPPNTWFAVFKADRAGTRALQPFTADAARLAAAVQAATLGDDARDLDMPPPATEPPPAPGEGQRPPGPPEVPKDLAASIGRAASTELGELSQRVRTYDSLYALMTISRSLLPVRGRKSVIYFGEAREVPDMRHAAYDSMVSTANRANVTIHTVDARGLTTARVDGRGGFEEANGLFSASSPTQGGRNSFTRNWTAQGEAGESDTGTLLPRSVMRNGDFLDHVANDTGGLAIARTNDLGAGLATVVEELGHYYELVYTPANPVQDGKYRRIQVKVSRPGVRVRTRSGYYATPASTPSLAAFELTLLAALAQPDAPRAFEHQTRLLQFAPREKEREAVFLAQVPTSAVVTESDTATRAYKAHLALLAVIEDASGRTVARLSHDWPIEGKLDPAGRPREASFVFRRVLPLAPGRYTVRTALQDRLSGGISTSRTETDVEAPAGGLALGALTVVRTAQPADPAAAPDPLTVGGVAVQPELGTPVLRSGTREVPLLLPVYAPAGAAPELQLELRRGGDSLVTVKPALPPPDAESRRAWVGSLSVGSLPAGRYEIVATVRAGTDTAESRTSFEISPKGDLPRAAGQPAGAPDPKAASVPAELVTVLDRAARYVLEYEQAFRDLAADEDYVQSVLMSDEGRLVKPIEGPARHLSLSCPIKPWCRLATRADVIFVRRSGGAGWSSFRDVHQVDIDRSTEKVREHEPRLEQLFSAFPSAEAERQAHALLLDSDARFNVGPCLRNLNEPTLGLLLLHPENQRRFAWKPAGKGTIDGVDAVEVAFEGVATPALLAQSDGESLPVSGRLWIDPVHGALLRSELEFRLAPRAARARVLVEYRMDRGLGIRVPTERREEYEDLPGGPPVFGSPSKAIARFSAYRRFTRTASTAAPTPSRVTPEGEHAAPTYSPALAQALQRAGEYVAEYERGFSDLVVEETYTQDVVAPVRRTERSGSLLNAYGSPNPDSSRGSGEPQTRIEMVHKKQTTRSDLVFVRLAGEFPWASYRDVFELNGKQVRDHEQRLVELFSKPSPDVHAQAERLLRASAQYNIGPVRRTVNLPTLPLVFLLPDNQSRFEFRLGERQTIAGTDAVALHFRETSRPTLVKGPNGVDLASSGRFWVSPTRGTVVRSEVDFDFGLEARARVSADYHPEPALAMWVPSEMREEYSDVARATVRTFPLPFKGVARYGKFRRFSVRSEEAGVTPAP